MCRGCREVVKTGWQVVRTMDALPANRSWPPPCSLGTYQHKAITSRSCQLLIMGTWLLETCWGTIRIEIRDTKCDIYLVFLIHTESLIFLMEDKPAFKKHVTSHYRSPIRVEKVERAGMTILRPDVCSNVGVNCVHSGSENTHLWGGL